MKKGEDEDGIGWYENGRLHLDVYKFLSFTNTLIYVYHMSVIEARKICFEIYRCGEAGTNWLPYFYSTRSVAVTIDRIVVQTSLACKTYLTDRRRR